MSTVKVTKAVGLYTSDNPYGTTPEGSLAQADNVVIRYKDVIEPRNGQAKLSYGFGGSTARAQEIFFFGSSPIVNYLESASYKMALDNGSSAFTDYSGTYTPPDTALLRMKAVEAEKNFYFTTTTGIKRLSLTSDAIASAGVPQISQPVPSAPALVGGIGGAGTWLPKNSAVGYRVQLGIKDSHGIIRWGPPSGRTVIINPSDVTADLSRTSNVVTATITAGTNYFDASYPILVPNATGDYATSVAGLTSVTATTLVYADSGADGTLAAQLITSGTLQPEFKIRLRSTWAGYYIRVWRTENSAGAGIDPGEEYYLLHEDVITAAEAAAGLYSYLNPTGDVFLDQIPEAGLSTIPLEINAQTGSGVKASPYEPPVAKDIAYWKNRAWFANTTQKHRYSLRMLGVGSPEGVQANDTITIGDRTYTATASASSNSSFKITTIRSAANNVIASTGSLLDRTIAQSYAGNSSYTGYYTGTQEEFGSFIIEANALGDGAFYVSASRPSSWSPQIPTTFPIASGNLSRSASTVTATTTGNHGFTTGDVVHLAANTADANFAVGTKTITVTGATTFTYTESGSATTSAQDYVVRKTTAVSTNEATPGRLYYSHLQRPDAVPLLNYLDIGASSKAIQRIVPLRDTLFVFKEDGLFAVTGEYPYRVEAIDSTLRLVAPDTAVPVAGKVYALTRQGVVAVTEGGVGVVSRPIESSLLSEMGTVISIPAFPLGVADETERSYYLWTSPGASNNEHAWVYNTMNGLWTKRTDDTRCARVSPSDYLYTGAASANTLTKENSSYYDDGSAVDITAVNGGGTLITLSSVSGISVGDVLVNDSLESFGLITAINGSVLTVTPAGSYSAVSNGFIYKQYPVVVVYNPQTLGAPGQSKQFRECTLHFGTSDFTYGYLTTKTELATTATSDQISATDVSTPKNFRKLIPLEKQRGILIQPGFSVNEAMATWKLYGYSLEADPMSERTMK